MKLRIGALLAAVLLLCCTGCDTQPGTSGPDGSDVSTSQRPTDEEITSDTEASTSTTKRGTSTTTATTGGKGTGATHTTTHPTSATTKPQTPTVKGQTLIADYIPNAAAWSFAGFPMWGDFTLQLQFGGYEPYNQVLVENSMRAYGLADTLAHFTHHVETYEWASYYLMGQGIVANAHPANREQAVNIVLDWLAQQCKDTAHPWAAMESYSRWYHYAGEAGYDYLGCENGARVDCANLSVAFARGAAKQFNRQTGDGNVDAWFVDFSLWGDGGMVNYSEQNPNMYKTQDGYHDNVGSSPLYGQSTSATRRAYYMAYMAGANWIISEAGGQAAFYDTLTEEGLYHLSPHGKVFQEFYAFSKRNPDRGITYTPFAVMIPREHGLPLPYAWKDNIYKPFDVFEPTDGDKMIKNIIETIYPDSFPYKTQYEVGQQAATPYGDTFDFLTQTANQDVMNSYPVIILAGTLQLSEYEKARLYNYVSQGGILVMNGVYKSQLTTFTSSQSLGKGRVIVYDNNYNITELDSILSDLCDELLPVQVEGTIEYLVNIKDGSVVVTLINNLGVEKRGGQAATYDKSQTQTVTVTYTGEGKVLEVNDWMTGKTRSAGKVQAIDIAPGDVAVLEFIL